MSFWNSPLIKNLESGKLPTVPVAIETKTIVTLVLAILLIITLSMFIYFVIKARLKS